MKIAIYARVSTSDQTCEQQLTALREYASRLGGKATEFVETASGRNNDRPELAKLMDLARRRKVDTIIVTKMDRFGRSVQKLVNDVTLLSSYNCRFIAFDQNIDTDKRSATGQLLMHIMAAFAEFERELISDRTKAGLARVRASGVRLGRAPRAVDVAGARRMLAEDGMSYRKVAKAMGIGVSILHRALNVKEATA